MGRESLIINLREVQTYLGGCFDVIVGGHIDIEALGGCFDVMVGRHIDIEIYLGG